jgi:hypothetical protein
VSYISETTTLCSGPRASSILQSAYSYIRLDICWRRGAVALFGTNLILSHPSVLQGKQTVTQELDESQRAKAVSWQSGKGRIQESKGQKAEISVGG